MRGTCHTQGKPAVIVFWASRSLSVLRTLQVLLIEPHSHFHHLFTFVSES